MGREDVSVRMLLLGNKQSPATLSSRCQLEGLLCKILILGSRLVDRHI